MDKKEKTLVGLFIEFFVYILRWLTLAMGIVMAGLTIGLIAVSIMKTDSSKAEFVAKMFHLITYYSKADALKLISDIGITKVIFAGIGYGVAYTIKYGCEYVILNNIVRVIDSIVKGNVYTQENVNVLNKTLPYTFIASFVQPVILYIVIFATSVFKTSDFDVSDLLLFGIIFVFKTVFEKGYELNKKTRKASSELSEVKASEAELKIELLKKESELRELREYKETSENELEKIQAKLKEAKKANRALAKEVAPKEEKKETVKKVAAKKETPKKEVKKVAAKKEEPKKAATKKVAAKKVEAKATKKVATKTATKKKTTK